MFPKDVSLLHFLCSYSQLPVLSLCFVLACSIFQAQTVNIKKKSSKIKVTKGEKVH